MGNFVKTYESFLNEAAPIEIVSMTDAGVSNRNKVETSRKFQDIENVLTDPDTWTDDISFKDKVGNVYFIDDLVDKAVKIGSKTITVVEERVNEGVGKYTVADFPVGAKAHMDDEVWMVVKPGARGNKVFMAPFNKEAKDRYISIAIEHDINFLNGAVTKIEI